LRRCAHAERGARLGSLLAARALLARGDKRGADRMRGSVALRWADLFHPFAWPYHLRRWLDGNVSSLIESAFATAIRVFRGQRYDYRYYERNRLAREAGMLKP